MALPLNLQNRIGNEFERKNLYLKDLAQGKSVKRQDHPYLKQLTDFQEKEAAFLKNVESLAAALPAHADATVDRLERQLFQAREKAAFYQAYVDLSYEAELAFKTAQTKIKHLPEIISTHEEIKAEIAANTAAKQSLDPALEQAAQSALSAYQKQMVSDKTAEFNRLSDLHKQGRIAKKALKNTKKNFVRSQKLVENDLRLQIPSNALAAEAKSLAYRESNDVKHMEQLMMAEVHELSQTIPMESNKTSAFWHYLTWPLPGLGQILNKQYIKGLLFLIGSLFIYLVAVPYALGYGNYMGNGVAGLITLGAGGKRLDKSVIYLIEGVIAVFLLLFAFGIMYFSFRDARKVERQGVQGIRPKNWALSKKAISDEGFPFVVTLPSFVLITFIVLVPIITTILLSFAGWDPQHQSKFSWIGLSNYTNLFVGKGLAAGLFWRILSWTLIWTVGASTLSILVGFFLALLLNNERIKGKFFFRTIFLLPWATPAFVTIMFFSIMLSTGGIMTDMFSAIAGKQLFVKDSITLTRIALILIKTWLGSSYIFILSTGVLQSIPGDLYEAAQIDGASAWNKLTRITLPLVLYQTMPLLIGQYTFNFNDFTIIWLFNGGGPPNTSLYGNLAGSSDILISYIFKLTMNNQFQSLGAAIAILISIGLMAVTYVGFSRSKAFKEMK